MWVWVWVRRGSQFHSLQRSGAWRAFGCPTLHHSFEPVSAAFLLTLIISFHMTLIQLAIFSFALLTTGTGNASTQVQASVLNMSFIYHLPRNLSGLIT